MRSTPAPPGSGGSTDRRALLALLDRILAYARERDYTGWDYADGMSSRIRRGLPVDNRWVNLAFQEGLKRAPVNLRPLALVEQRRNFKGAALFAMANMTAGRQRASLAAGSGRTGGTTSAAAGRTDTDDATDTSAGPRSTTASASPSVVDYAAEARYLLEWLLANRSTGYSGFCGGHKHEIQGLAGRGEPNEADVVSTAYPVRALLRAEPLDERYPDVARTAVEVVIEDHEYREVPTGAVVKYYLGHTDEAYTINAGAIAARLLLDVHAHFGDESLREPATKLLDHVVSLQTDRGGWYYRDPPEASHLSMDSHHNGFVVECLQRYEEVVGDGRFEAPLERAMRFYRDELFEPDGAPDFDEESAYPRDVHAAAQGIVVFAYAGEFDRADRVLGWTLDNLHAGGGRFYARKHRLYTQRHVLMRWCQAWMAYAVAELVDRRYPTGGDDGVEWPPA